MLKTALIRLVYMGIMFVAGLVLSNLALPEKFGSISLLILNASLLSLVSGFGSESMILYKVSNNYWNMPQAFQFAWRTIFVQVTIFFLLELSSLFFFNTTLLSSETVGYFAVDAIYFFGLVIVEKYLALFYASNMSKKVNLLLVLIGIVYLVLLLLFHYLVEVDFVVVIYLFALQSLIQGIILVIYFGFRHHRQSGLENKDFFSAVKLSSVVMVTNIIQLFAYRVDFWLLKYFYGNNEVGLYAQANKFANLSWIIPNILAQLLFPRFAGMDKRQVKEVFSVSFYFNFLIVLATIICTQIVYSSFLQPEYALGLPAFYIMLPGYFFWGSVIYFGSFVSAMGKFSYNLMGSLFCLILIVCADLILIPRYGITGAAVANSICYTLIFIWYLYLLTMKLSVRLNNFLLPSKKIWSNVINFIGE